MAPSVGPLSPAHDACVAEASRLNRTIQALMDRAERSSSIHGTDFTLFQTAVMLEDRVRSRTQELEAALRHNEAMTRALRESEARFRGVVSHSLIGIAVIEDGKFSYSNDKFDQIFGYDHDEISELGPLDVTAACDRDLVAEMIRRRMVGESDAVAYTFQGLRKNGMMIDVEYHGSRMDNRPEGAERPLLISSVLDISERVRAERELGAIQEQLKTTNDSLRDFVAVAAHDLRSPLVTIGGFAEILTDNWATLSEDERLKYLGAINRGVSRLSRLTNDLLTSARVEGAAEQVRPEHVRLATALAGYLEANREDLGTVRVTCPPELVAVVDPPHLTRILDNYVGNAFKYGDPPVSIEAEQVGDFVELRVRDQGPGVPPEFVSRLFTKFSRADTSTTRAQPGTGLGLSIVKGLAKANHGDASYQRDEPNGGCFVVRLPAAVA